MDYALIGGTGVEYLPLADRYSRTVDTPYGSVSVEIGSLGTKELVFLRRHGRNHSIPPHLINYRGNIWALKELGVKKILATGAVGTITDRFRVGEIVLADQFLDFTKSRKQTFFEGGEQGVLHVDVSEPYCRELRAAICRAAEDLDLKIHNGGVYVCTEGPRFETPAEIKMFRILGGELVGMTGVPEVVLAREMGMCYSTIALVTNAAAGVAEQPLTHAEVLATMNLLGENVARLIEQTMQILGPEQNCYCISGSAEAGKF